MIMKNKCIDCGVKLNNSKSKRCRKCFSKTLEKPHYCEVCGKRLNSYYAKKCWDCYTNDRNRKIAYCEICNKQLSSPQAKKCKKCHMQYKFQLQIGKKHSYQHNQKIGKHSKKCWQNADYRQKTIQAQRKGLHVKKNKCEMALEHLLQCLFKNNYKFVGDGKLIVNGFNPDFVDIKNKKIIEMYGDYWHNKKSYIERDKRREIAYKNNQYELLIVWEHELKEIDKLTNKLLKYATV